MRFTIFTLAFAALFLGAAQASAKSCAGFAVIKSYDATAKTITASFEKGSMKKYFPKPEGSPSDSTKIPKGCTGKVKKAKSFVVKPTGGRMTVTQLRSNFEGKMLNKDDAAWFQGEMDKLVSSKTPVVVVVRPGMKKKDPLSVTTIYLPITEQELAEIERIEKQAEDI